MINHVFSHDFYSRMVLFTCRILIGSIVRLSEQLSDEPALSLTEVAEQYCDTKSF